MPWLIDAIYKIIAIAIALTAHEYIKAVVSARQGDPLPRSRGRLTLNPLKHLEPIGFICMFAYGFGWGRPVDTSATYYADRRKATIITYTFPTVFNLFLCVIFAVLFKILNALPINVPTANTFVILIMSGIVKTVYYAAYYNFMAVLSNIIPVYPMDGAKVLSLFLPPAAVMKMSAYEKILQVILILLMFMGVLNLVFLPFISMFIRLMW